jgi:RHS repeat-associated protein
MDVSVSAVTNTVAYDSLGRQIAITDGRSNTRRTEYNALGQRVASIDALGNRTAYTYDHFGNLTSVINPLVNAIVYEYDLRRRKTYEGGATYPVRYAYNDYNLMTNMTTYRREGRGNGEEGSVGDTTTWLYDEPTGLLTNKVYADGKGYSCTYTVDGRLQFKAEASGRWKEFLYNDWGELVNTICFDGEVISTLRDAQGREVLETNNVASILKWRDEFGNVTNETISVGAESMSLTRLYDDVGREFCLASGLCIGYDASGRYSILSNNEAIVQYAYNSDGSEMGYTISLSNGMVFARNVYRDSEHPERIAAISNCVNGVLVENFDYTYDLLGRPVVRNSDTFGYNARSEVVFSHRGTENAEDGYAYDDIGNLLVSYIGANTNSYSANNLNQYTSILHASAPSSEDYLFYDLDGNLTNDSVFAYSYDAQNRLVSVLSNDVALLVNEYDSKSRRVMKVTLGATTTYFYDDWNLIEERIAYANGTTSTIKYYWGKDLSGSLQGAGGVGGLLYLTVDDEIYIPCYDNNGNITQYVDVSGYSVASYAYDSFGGIIVKSGTLADFFRHRFSTKYFDPETGLYYYGYRFYNPDHMRWLNRDPIEEEDGANLYLYCKNSTLLTYDLFGLKANWHHLLPRQFEHKFVTAGIDIDAAEYGVILEALDHTGQGGLHPSWNRDWGAFFEKNPNATKSQIIAHLEKMKKSDQYSSILGKGVKTKLNYSAWRRAADQARKATTKVAAKSLAKRGLAQGTKKIVKRVPIVGLVFVYADIKDKGFIKGVCNSVLDACPFVGWGKLGTECIWGDWFPDNEDHRNE